MPFIFCFLHTFDYSKFFLKNPKKRPPTNNFMYTMSATGALQVFPPYIALNPSCTSHIGKWFSILHFLNSN